jgi:hypothetical protein
MRSILLAVLAIATVVGAIGCGSGTTLYTVEPGGHLAKITSDPAEMFRHTVIREAEFEAQGKPPARPGKTWRDYWIKVAPYLIGAQEFGTHERVLAYIREQRKARGLPSL